MLIYKDVLGLWRMRVLRFLQNKLMNSEENFFIYQEQFVYIIVIDNFNKWQWYNVQEFIFCLCKNFVIGLDGFLG